MLELKKTHKNANKNMKNAYGYRKRFYFEIASFGEKPKYAV